MKNKFHFLIKNTKIKSNTLNMNNSKENLSQSIKKFSLTNPQIILLAVSIIFIILGIIFGDCITIFRKAIFLCMECIGIG